VEREARGAERAAAARRRLVVVILRMEQQIRLRNMKLKKPTAKSVTVAAE